MAGTQACLRWILLSAHTIKISVLQLTIKKLPSVKGRELVIPPVTLLDTPVYLPVYPLPVTGESVRIYSGYSCFNSETLKWSSICFTWSGLAPTPARCAFHCKCTVFVIVVSIIFFHGTYSTPGILSSQGILCFYPTRTNAYISLYFSRDIRK